MIYPVTDIFGPTLQGEGHFVGYPAIFVRLAGCSVRGCHIRNECDEEPWETRWRLGAVQIRRDVDVLASPGAELPPHHGIVVITGGEPAQYDLIPLVDELTKCGYRVHLETSGAYSVAGIPIEWVTVSPKTRDYVQRVGHALKVVVRPGWSWEQIRELDEGTQFFHRYLQPLTLPDGSTNLREVIALLTGPENIPGRWALSTQAHKVWHVDESVKRPSVGRPARFPLSPPRGEIE